MELAKTRELNRTVEQKPDWALIRLPEVLDLIPVSRTTFLTEVRKGRYPAPVRLSRSCTAWRWGEIKALAESFTVGEGE